MDEEQNASNEEGSMSGSLDSRVSFVEEVRACESTKNYPRNVSAVSYTIDSTFVSQPELNQTQLSAMSRVGNMKSFGVQENERQKR